MASDKSWMKDASWPRRYWLCLPKDVSRMFYTKMKRRQLGRIVRLLDRMLAQGGDDRRLASTALGRLGFPVEQR